MGFEHKEDGFNIRGLRASLPEPSDLIGEADPSLEGGAASCKPDPVCTFSLTLIDIARDIHRLSPSLQNLYVPDEGNVTPTK